jgi:hypothetical protein
MRSHALILAATIVAALPLSLHAQSRDFRAGRFVLDDDNADADGMHTLTIAAPALAADRSVTIPDATGTLLLTTASLSPGRLLFGASAGTVGESAALFWNIGTSTLAATNLSTTSLTASTIDATTVTATTFDDGEATLGGGELNGIERLHGPLVGGIELVSEGSITLTIDADNSGIGSSVTIESNGAPTDLFSVTETGLTAVTSSSASGALRVANTNAGGTVPIVELTDGSATRLLLRRNGNAGLGDVTPDARLDLENNSTTEPALQVANMSTTGVGLEIVEGKVLLSYGIGTVATVPSDVAVWTIADNATATGLTVALPGGGANGQILYVHYADAHAGTVGGNAALTGDAFTFLFVNGAWRLFHRN